MLALGMPGIPELIIIGFFLLVVVAIIVAVILAVRIGRKPTGQNPNLGTCPDCGNAISIHAKSCPKCGRPM
jgi:hypothetical protein